MDLSGELKAIRAHDMQPGLSGVNMGLVNANMKKVKLVGAAAQIASLIKGINVISYNALEVAAGDLGIDENLLEKALHELEEVDFVSVIKKSGYIDRVEERISLLLDFYSVLGQRIDQLNISEIESTAIRILDDLSIMPMAVVELCDKYRIESREFKIIKDIGKNTGFLDEYTSPTDSREIIYSPFSSVA